MVFSSVPLYLDPHNWHHHQQQQQAQLHQQLQGQQLSGGHGGGDNNPHSHGQQVGAAQMPPPAPSQAVGGSSSIRPGSMADRARQAKIPQPEPGLKCPRCESTNTKFCYFNNYSLTQPRHFCKTCRRYWTRGGALRNVPVGGGCRRNKRSGKAGGASKALGGERQIVGVGPTNNNINNSTSPISSNSNNNDMNNNCNMLDHQSSFHHQPRLLAQYPLLASLQGLQYGSPSSNLGLNFGGGMMSGTAAQAELGFQIGANSGASDQWRPPHHFPNFLAGFDPPSSSSNLYQFPIDHQSLDQPAAANPNPPRTSISSAMNQQQPIRPSNNDQQSNNESAAAAVKAEEAAGQQGGMNMNMNLLSRSFLGMPDNNSSQYWIGSHNNNSNNNSTWTDLSGLNSSTTSLL